MGERMNAIDWDEGCQTDLVRNDFIIPTLVDFINIEQPGRILDIGAATGYIASKVEEASEVQAEWFLVDRCSERLELARANCESRNNFRFYNFDFLDVPSEELSADCVILCNTLLEIDHNERLFRHVSEIVTAGGALIIAYPDVLTDVFALQDRAKQSEFIEGRLDIRKTDKFTGRSYRFNAARPLFLLREFLNRGFSLEKMEFFAEAGGCHLWLFKKQR